MCQSYFIKKVFGTCVEASGAQEESSILVVRFSALVAIFQKTSERQNMI